MIHSDELSTNAMGGTEMMKNRLQKSFKGNLHRFRNKVQIVVSRERELLDNVPAIFWAHDLADDPEAHKALGDGRWNRYVKIVFVSYWQKSKYQFAYGLPDSRCEVIENACDLQNIDVIREKTNDTINIVYTPTPHRGLELLYPAFEYLNEKYNNLHLDVFSSFELYGWKERDKPYKVLFEKLKSHPNITYHGTQPNEVVIDRLKKTNIFAYPSIWQETSGITLMEAMTTGNLIVSSDLAAIPETTAKLGYLSSCNENPTSHLMNFIPLLEKAIIGITHEYDAIKSSVLTLAHNYSTLMYGWKSLERKWGNLFTEVTNIA